MSGRQQGETAEYEGQDKHGDVHTKQLCVKAGDPPNIVFRAESVYQSKNNKEDEKSFEWDRFREIMQAIEAESGTEFIQNHLVGDSSGVESTAGTKFTNGTTTICMVESTASENGSYLHFYYDGDEERFTLRWVQSLKDGSQPGNKGSPAGDIYSWQVQPHELTQLVENSATHSGFSHELREALFHDRDSNRVRQLI